MGRFVSVLACVLALGAGSALAQPTKKVTGTITKISADSITINAAGQDMTFAIDSKTQIVAPGGGTKTRAAEAEGKTGVAATALLKEGQPVDLQYHEQGMHAAHIRVRSSVPSPPSLDGPKATTASGVVSAVSGNSLTVKGSDSEWTFSVDEKTTISGSGMGTAQRKVTAEKGKPGLTDFLGEGDRVSVTYHEVGATRLASMIRVISKKK
jgi:hypothetical protein